MTQLKDCVCGNAISVPIDTLRVAIVSNQIGIIGMVLKRMGQQLGAELVLGIYWN